MAQVFGSFQETTRTRAARAEDRVRVQLVTDPWSVWCWGFEPVRRTLELRYPSIEFQALLGGMFPQMPDPKQMGFDVERFFNQVNRTTGMPVGLESVRNNSPGSTFPACVSVHAARLADPEGEARFLRVLREAVYIDGLDASKPSVGRQAARRVGIDLEAYDDELASGRAQEAFELRMEELTHANLFAYPTLLVTSRGKTTRIEGFQSLPAVVGVVEAVSDRLHPPLPDPPLEAIVPEGERVATREVGEALGISLERAFERLRKAQRKGDLVRRRLPQGDVWMRPGTPAGFS